MSEGGAGGGGEAGGETEGVSGAGGGDESEAGAGGGAGGGGEAGGETEGVGGAGGGDEGKDGHGEKVSAGDIEGKPGAGASGGSAGQTYAARLEEESGEMRRRQEELQAQAEAALREARQHVLGQYRGAIRKTLSAAERKLAQMVAEGPRGSRSRTYAIQLPHARKKRSRTFSAEVRRGTPLLDRGRGLAILAANRDVIGRGAGAMAARLKKMKMRVRKTAYMQKKGNLDRRRLSAAIKGSQRIRMQPADRRDLSMAVSMSVDISGSMYDSADKLGTIVGMVSRGLEQAEVPYEVRAYNGRQFHVKSFAERRITDDQIASMYVAGGDNDDTVSIALGGLALRSRGEAAKVQFVVTDGDPGAERFEREYGRYGGPESREEVRLAVENNRDHRVIVMGIFYAAPSGRSREDVADKFDRMYGPGNWAYIARLEELPRVVTETLEAQLARYLPR